MANTDKTLRSAFAQKTMWEAAQYRLLRKAPARAAPKDLPSVQRPGVSQPRGSGEAANVPEAQRTLHHRARCNVAARRGEYDASMETA